MARRLGPLVTVLGVNFNAERAGMSPRVRGPKADGHFWASCDWGL